MPLVLGIMGPEQAVGSQMAHREETPWPLLCPGRRWQRTLPVCLSSGGPQQASQASGMVYTAFKVVMSRRR